MKEPRLQQPGHPPRWRWIVAATIVLLVALLIGPQIPVLATLLRGSPIPVLFVVGLAGFYCRRRPLDALLFVVAHLCAEFFGEPVVGPTALAIASLGLLALTGRPRFGLFAGVVLFTLLLIGVELKRRFAGSVLTWQDLRYFFLQFQDNVGVLASQPTLLMYSGAALAAGVGAMVLFWRLDGPFVGGPGPQARQSVRSHRIARGLALLMSLWCSAELYTASRVTAQKAAWDFSEAKSQSPVTTFFSTLHLQPTAIFERVDTGGFAREVKALRSATTSASPRPADIVLFLQESQFNPMSIRGCPPSFCDASVFHADRWTTDDGEFRVHLHGGGTWLSEFALATGVPHTLFGRAGDYASFNVAPGVQRSFVRSLKAAGYHTVAVYPVGGGMMNARAAYQAYGFDEFLDSDALGLPGRFETPDSRIHEAALKTLEVARQQGKPVFLLALTIFNHGEHGVARRPVPEAVRQEAQQAGGSPIEVANIADFVYRTREFDSAYRQTRSAVLEAQRPAVLAWFGDHQPPFGNAPGLRSRIQGSSAQPTVPDRFLTWYNVSSNLAPPAATARRHRLDIVFLPGLLAQRAGVPLDDWLAANVLARERCGGLLAECTEAGARDAYLSYLLGDLQAIR